MYQGLIGNELGVDWSASGLEFIPLTLRYGSPQNLVDDICTLCEFRDELVTVARRVDPTAAEVYEDIPLREKGLWTQSVDECNSCPSPKFPK